MCSIREYYFDWQPREPATFTIEYLGGEPVRPPSTFGDAMDEALDLTERSIVFWNQYMIVARDKQNDNTFGDKIDVPRGLQLSQFGFCFYDLAPDEALHVHADVPDARYWSLQLYRMRWFSPYDIARSTSLNQTQMHVGADGRFHVVVAHRDPGVANWLDTEGRVQGLVNFRYFWGTRLPTLDGRGRARRRHPLGPARRCAAGRRRTAFGRAASPPRPPRVALPHLSRPSIGSVG